MTECPAVAGAVVRPLVDPVPVYPWAMVHRTGAAHPALSTLRSAAKDLAGTVGSVSRPDDAWVPRVDDHMLGA
jgi:hypothetical protein